MEKFYWVFENDQGSWSRVNPKMDSFLKLPRAPFHIGEEYAGINSRFLYPNAIHPVYEICSFLDGGMSGNRIWTQKNLTTGRKRGLKLVSE
jgi:hypothetical protein